MTGHLLTAAGGLLVGFALRSLIWWWFLRCPRRVAWYLATMIEEWAKRSGHAYVYVDPARVTLHDDQTPALAIEWLVEKLREYAGEKGHP